jgi:hypothetical protein
MRTEGEASLQALVSHTSEILFLTAYMINFTPTDLLFSFPEEGKRSVMPSPPVVCRVSCVSCVCVCVRIPIFLSHNAGSNQRLSNYSSPYMETDSLKVDDRPGARSRPTSTEPTAASALGTDEEGRVPRRPTIPYAPLRISNTAAPAEDTASVYIDEQSLDDSQSVINACRVPCAVCRAPCAVRRAPCAHFLTLVLRPPVLSAPRAVRPTRRWERSIRGPI